MLFFLEKHFQNIDPVEIRKKVEEIKKKEKTSHQQNFLYLLDHIFILIKKQLDSWKKLEEKWIIIRNTFLREKILNIFINKKKGIFLCGIDHVKDEKVLKDVKKFSRIYKNPFLFLIPCLDKDEQDIYTNYKKNFPERKISIEFKACLEKNLSTSLDKEKEKLANWTRKEDDSIEPELDLELIKKQISICNEHKINAHNNHFGFWNSWVYLILMKEKEKLEEQLGIKLD